MIMFPLTVGNLPKMMLNRLRPVMMVTSYKFTRSHLQFPASEKIQKKQNLIAVQFVTKISPINVTLRFMREFTQEKGPTSAGFVIILLLGRITSKCMRGLTLERNHTPASYAANRFHLKNILLHMKGLIQERNLMPVELVKSLSLINLP